MGQPRRERSAAQAWPLCICTQEQGLGRDPCGNCFDLVCKSYYISLVRIAETLLSLVEGTLYNSWQFSSLRDAKLFPRLRTMTADILQALVLGHNSSQQGAIRPPCLAPCHLHLVKLWVRQGIPHVPEYTQFSAIALKQTAGHKDFLKSWIWSRLWRDTQARDHTNR